MASGYVRRDLSLIHHHIHIHTNTLQMASIFREKFRTIFVCLGWLDLSPHLIQPFRISTSLNRTNCCQYAKFTHTEQMYIYINIYYVFCLFQVTIIAVLNITQTLYILTSLCLIYSTVPFITAFKWKILLVLNE